MVQILQIIVLRLVNVNAIDGGYSVDISTTFPSITTFPVTGIYDKNMLLFLVNLVEQPKHILLIKFTAVYKLL